MIKLKNYLSLIKFSHTIFAMPFALIGFFVAVFHDKLSILNTQWNLNRTVGWGWDKTIFYSSFVKELSIKLLLVILCMVFARSAAMAFNRYLDREFDARNPRTANREIPKGIISPKNALLFTIISCILFVVTCYFINGICFYLSPVALAVILGYSYTKRFTSFSHLVLGLGLSLAPIGAFLAVRGEFELLPILFSLAVLFWVSGFDIIYALQDEEFDREQSLHSIPARLGKKKALRVSEYLHMFCAVCIVYAGLITAFGWLYWVGATIFIAMLIYQHSIIKPNDLRRVNLAFMTANGIASVVFAIFVITDLFL